MSISQTRNVKSTLRPEISDRCPDTICDLLRILYPNDEPQDLWCVLRLLMKQYDARLDCLAERRVARGLAVSTHQKMSETDVFLITYADSVRHGEKKPLKVLKAFLDQYLPNVFTTVHVLPFYPYSSDDGFSVIDYQAVAPSLGEWNDIHELGRSRNLMFDAVINHISAKSYCFQRYLAKDPDFASLCIEKESGADYSQVVRPRTTPLFTEFTAVDGKKLLWTTFSSDQVDLNYRDFHTFLLVFDVLLFYVVQGASVLRFDAVSYLWKEQGTSCSNLEKCHKLIQLFRALLDVVSPWVSILTETNVPHDENIRYFGNGRNEAQMVYQFALPPLVAHTFLHGDVTKLRGWVCGLEYMTGCTYFNFLSSHDGVGIIPVKDILSDSEVDELVERTRSEGGFISYKSTSRGEQIPYELNTTYFSLICSQEETEEIRIRKFISSQSILLALKGIPALYYHSLFGSPNDRNSVAATGMLRSINRKKFSWEELRNLLNNPDTESSRIFDALTRLIVIRKRHPAFNPASSQVVLDVGNSVFSLLRACQEERILSVVNVSLHPVEINVSAFAMELSPRAVIAGQCDITYHDDDMVIRLAPYGFAWVECGCGDLP